MAKILFIQDVLFDFHGIECLSAVVKRAGHEADVFILDADGDDYISYIKKNNIDAIGFSISSTDYKWSLHVAQDIKQQLALPIIFGGPHPTYFPEFINHPLVDMMCIGEGEYALVEVLNAVDARTDMSHIQNIYIKKDGQVFKNELRPLMNLNDLPMPDRGMYYRYSFLNKMPTKRITPTRGCPYNCSYCYNQNYKQLYRGKGVYVRYRPAHGIIEEIEYIKNNARLNYITFVADTFTSNKPWLKELLTLYQDKIKVPFFSQSEANEIDEEIVVMLKNAGCHYFSFGIESGNERIRNEILNKKISNAQIIKVADILKKFRIPFCTFNMFCLPQETLNEALETMTLNAMIESDVVSGTILQPTVGTQIFEYSKNNGLFDDHYATSTIAGHYQESPLKIQNKKEILNLQRIFFLGVRFPWLTPLIKLLIKLSPNIIFELILKITLFIRYKKTRNYSYFDMLKLGWHLRKYV